MTQDTKEAARILRGLKRRIERLEGEREPEGELNLLRTLADESEADDTLARSTTASPGFVYGTSIYGFAEWT